MNLLINGGGGFGNMELLSPSRQKATFAFWCVRRGTSLRATENRRNTKPCSFMDESDPTPVETSPDPEEAYTEKMEVLLNEERMALAERTVQELYAAGQVRLAILWQRLLAGTPKKDIAKELDVLPQSISSDIDRIKKHVLRQKGAGRLSLR